MKTAAAAATGVCYDVVADEDENAASDKEDANRKRNLKIFKALLKSQAHQGTSLFTSVATNQRGFSKREAQVLGDRVAVKVGVVQVEKVNDQMDQGRRV